MGKYIQNSEHSIMTSQYRHNFAVWRINWQNNKIVYFVGTQKIRHFSRVLVQVINITSSYTEIIAKYATSLINTFKVSKRFQS